MLNKVMLIGNLGADPETRFSQGGLEIVNFRMATTERYKDKDQTEWHNIVAFGKLAEIIGKYLKKGDGTYVEGKLQTRKWQDREGNDRYTTEIVAHDVKFLPKKKDNGGGSPSEYSWIGDDVPY